LASAAAIALTGATPVFVDVGADYNLNPQLLTNAITPRTKAILPVHLTGKPAQMPEILAIFIESSQSWFARPRSLRILEL